MRTSQRLPAIGMYCVVKNVLSPKPGLYPSSLKEVTSKPQNFVRIPVYLLLIVGLWIVFANKVAQEGD